MERADHSVGQVQHLLFSGMDQHSQMTGGVSRRQYDGNAGRDLNLAIYELQTRL